MDLETDTYAHVDLTIMSKFKALIRKYSHAFYLPGSELTPITGFHHNIDTGDSPPVYRLPYRKSPSELAAIKDELQKMLKLHIIRPSTASHVNPELCQVAYEFGKYLASLPNKTATASQACKQVYLSYPSAREILTRHGKPRGLIKACPYLQMDGEAHGGLYLLSLNQEAFRKLFPSL